MFNVRRGSGLTGCCFCKAAVLDWFYGFYGVYGVYGVYGFYGFYGVLWGLWVLCIFYAFYGLCCLINFITPKNFGCETPPFFWFCFAVSLVGIELTTSWLTLVRMWHPDN